MTEVLTFIGLALSIVLMGSCLFFVRSANGESPLLIGIMVSGAFGLYVSVLRQWHLGSDMREVTSWVVVVWLSFKLWAIYASMLGTRRPFRVLARRFFGWLFGNKRRNI